MVEFSSEDGAVLTAVAATVTKVAAPTISTTAAPTTATTTTPKRRLQVQRDYDFILLTDEMISAGMDSEIMISSY